MFSAGSRAVRRWMPAAAVGRSTAARMAPRVGARAPCWSAAAPLATVSGFSSPVSWRSFAKAAAGGGAAEDFDITKLRNIGISAHIDSGKTTLTERILFYTGRIDSIHDVRGKDGVGAKMDSMELEREKGITIQSAATYCSWGDSHINIIDTPGHVDFTVEVERALRVLDGAVLVLCGVSGVQSQSITVDRQMKRYNVPRLAFINKLDRQGSDPFHVIEQLREKLKLNAAAIQIPIGLENEHQGAVDIIARKSYTFDGANGEHVVVGEVPADMEELVEEKRAELLERLGDVDEEIMELYLMEEEPTEEQLHDAIRRATIDLNFVPVLLGSAFKNKGVQPLLDAVLRYLPNPSEITNVALDRDNDEAEVVTASDPDKNLVALAFKLEESRFGQLTYLRVYQGSLKRGGFIYNIDANKDRIKVPRLVRLHSNEMEDVDGAQAGEIIAMFGVDCHSGDTFTDGTNLAMTSMFCPEPVISYSIKVTKSNDLTKLSKALNRFQKEDPTFKVHVDPDSKETIISGMGELHLDIYVERMRREYDITVEVSEPRVNYRETITKRAEFNYLHKKQSGGSGQFGRVIGYVEPLEEGSYEFVNAIIGNAIPPEYINAVQKGFEEALEKGPQIGHRVQGVKVVLTDGQAHMVDSSELAFKLAAQYAFRDVCPRAGAAILEPLMKVEVEVPEEFQSTAIGLLNQRKGQLQNSETREGNTTIEALVPLSSMFGFSTALRSGTQGKGEFTMEYHTHSQVPRDLADTLRKQFLDSQPGAK